MESIRKESQDLYNRLHSIAEDATFVEQAQRAYPDLPLLPNLRCGAWYADPTTTGHSFSHWAYFKSTDGHTGNWGFNLRRPNLHILPLLAQHRGIVLVDSTRAGKRMPDSLSKTVPIWCAVINRAIHRLKPSSETANWNNKLYTPPGVVSAQEHDRIESRLDGWADDLVASFYRLPELTLPLRPIWITPSTSVFPEFLDVGDRKYIPVICLSASKQIFDGMERRAHAFTYIQGSGDDHELWGMGLTPDLFWQNREKILNESREGLPVLVRSIVSASREELVPTG
ncbi:hypothetical protein SERLA73DRAFT_51306, partial [Serpula lacrymans var. lacrymans S7.3]